MGKYYYKIPRTIQLYTVCEVCGELKPWPENRATKYCSRSCKDKAYYNRKFKKGQEEISSASFSDEAD